MIKYRNGREAKTGDRAVSPHGSIGTLYLVAHTPSMFDGRLVVDDEYTPHVTVSECLHLEDTTVDSKE